MVAKKIYKESPSLAGIITAAISEEYSAIKVHLGENYVLKSILIDITAESLIRGIGVARGVPFAEKVGREYIKLSPSLGKLAETCAKATAFGISQEQGMTGEVLGGSEVLNETQIAVQLEKFITLFTPSTLNKLSAKYEIYMLKNSFIESSSFKERYPDITSWIEENSFISVHSLNNNAEILKLDVSNP